MSKALVQAVQTVRGIVSVLRAFASSTKSAEEDELLQQQQGHAPVLAPDLVVFFKDDQSVAKVVTSFQRSGFVVQELAPGIFAFSCKHEVLLQACEKLGWKRFTKSYVCSPLRKELSSLLGLRRR